MSTLTTGTLWLDTDKKKPLATKVIEAASFYKGKYGTWPDTCVIPMSIAEQKPETGYFSFEACGNIEIRTARFILPFHIWIGVAEKEKAKE